ncbi:lectin [Capsulimonas corticalis]|uniref:Lectin n=1 Tax=Capsulimonas corticalis TaxID=2219043 RepID=A0A402D6A1_9BACT|nr:lectin [Capsulimonas corticalis]BDI32041.1 lectin [Capsulimonas corticalis]
MHAQLNGVKGVGLRILGLGLAALALGFGGAARAASPPGDVVGKVTVGYQGWFSAPGDGSPVNNWGHTNLETWPDMREYTAAYQTAYPNLGNGQPATNFSSYDQSTVNIHFNWMAQNGIDTAALQRFGNEIVPGSTLKAQRDGEATRVMNAAQTNGRKFYIMYDMSGGTTYLQSDWTNTIVNTLHLTSSSAYAKQNGKPVVCLWGLGYTWFGLSPTDGLSLVNWFKNQGCYVIGGVPGQWRTGTGDSRPDYATVYNTCNMVMAWAVGRVVDSTYQPWVSGDLAYCNANGMDYQPDAYPGTSFYNTNGPSSPKNQYPRNHGDFMWSQFAAMRNAGASSVYISMFDEMNEATSIFKCAEDSSMIPANNWFLTLDADGVHVSSDYYLRLTCDGGKMIKGQIPYQTAHPTPFTITGVTFYQDTLYGGGFGQALAKGSYTLAQLAAKGVPNDWASSVRIPPGWTVIMYSDDNFSGTSWTLTSDNSNFPGLSPNGNDVMSSCKIQ